jgi:hypothetical protein
MGTVRGEFGAEADSVSSLWIEVGACHRVIQQARNVDGTRFSYTSGVLGMGFPMDSR